MISSFLNNLSILAKKLILKIDKMVFKMVLTRSQENKLKEDKAPNDQNVETEHPIQKKKLKLANILSKALTKTLEKKKKEKVLNEEEEEEEEEGEEEEEEEDDFVDEEEEELFEDDYTLPSDLKDDEKIHAKCKKMIEKIKSNNPNLRTILNGKMKYKDKMELFELYFIYRFVDPNTEERLALKTHIKEKIKTAKENFQQYTKHADKIKYLEKKLSNHDELYELRNAILELDCENEAREYLYQKYLILEKSEMKDEEYIKVKLILKEALQLPFNKCLKLPLESPTMNILKNIRTIFDQELFGMDNVKEQLMIFFHNKFMNPTAKGCCLGLLGPAGVGKTTIAQCLAKILQLPFEQISLGGLSSGESMKGHDSTYIGARPGQIAKAMMKLKSKAGILFFDEFDKIDGNPDLVNSMLHITDFQQNDQFRDNFFGELKIDLSSLWIICSMNDKNKNEILADRIFYINVDGYSFKDKIKIIQNYVIPKILKEMSQDEKNVIFSEEIIRYFVSTYDKDSNKGIRTLQARMRDLLSKVFFLKTVQNDIKVTFSLPQKYFPIEFPFTITKEVLDILLKDTKKDNNNLLYLYV